jgi:hypothetical protein
MKFLKNGVEEKKEVAKTEEVRYATENLPCRK